MSGDLENLILRTVERWWASRYSERHGLITSYDPQKYLAKVMYQPEGFESGWLPIETGHIGNGYGIAVGLVTGDGKSTGDQVIVRFQEGDFESGKIVQRVHSDQDKPPTVQSGEMVMWTKWGQKVYFKNDGTLSIQTGQTPQGQTPAQGQKQTTILLDNNGNITTTVDNDHSTTAKNNINETAGQTHQTSANTIGETAQQDNNRKTVSGDINDNSGRTYNNNAKKVVNVQGGGKSVPPTTIS